MQINFSVLEEPVSEEGNYYLLLKKKLELKEFHFKTGLCNNRNSN